MPTYPVTREGPKSGIYEIRRVDGGKCYIGSSKRLWPRWVQHRRDLRMGTHHNRHLQRAWELYGEDQFQMLVLEECEPSLLLERERYHVTSRSLADVYNMADIGVDGSGGTRRGQRNTPEHRARISASLVGKSFRRTSKNTWAAKAEASRVENLEYYVLASHPDGRILKFDSTVHAARHLGLHRKTVCNIVNNRNGFTKTGWTFTRVAKTTLGAEDARLSLFLPEVPA